MWFLRAKVMILPPTDIAYMHHLEKNFNPNLCLILNINVEYSYDVYNNEYGALG